MTRWFIFLGLVLMGLGTSFATQEPRPNLGGPVIVHGRFIAADHEVDGHDIGWVEFRDRDSGAAISCGGDLDLPLMQWFKAHRGTTFESAPDVVLIIDAPQ